MSIMEDYVIETQKAGEIQKHLRQWRHEYNIQIIHYEVVDKEKLMVHVCIKRTKKQNQNGNYHVGTGRRY